MSGIDEETVRLIVREEMKSLLKSLEENFGSESRYTGSDLESAALYAVEGVMRSEAEYMPHDWECAKRIGSWPNNACDCDVDERGKSDD